MSARLRAERHLRNCRSYLDKEQYQRDSDGNRQRRTIPKKLNPACLAM